MPRITIDKRAVAARLAGLERDGRITPAQLVEDSRDPASPAHSWFEWNDAVAGNEYRLDQARALIAAVRVEVRTETTIIRSVAYVRDPAAGAQEQGYVSVAKLRTEHDLARESLLYEVTRAAAMLRRARELAVAFGIEGDVDRVLAGIETVHQVLATHTHTSHTH